MRLYLDTCAIQRPLDNQSSLRVRAETEAILSLLGLFEAGLIELMASAAHVIENSRNPHFDRRDHLRAVITEPTYITTDAEVRSLAATFGEMGIAPLDALHLAAAVVGGASYFCTTDDDLLRKARLADTRHTEVVSPLELIALLP
jgi:predicted nucleic acid-binding protein